MYSEITANKTKSALILLGFFGFVGLVAYIFSLIYGNPSITIYALIGAAVYALISYMGSAKMALALNGAREITRRDNPKLWSVVENIAMVDGLPMPRVYIINDPGLNAFATGRNPENASVAITSGLLEVLTKAELQGVMAHELGHVKNYDIRVSMMAFALASIISLLCDFFLRASWFGAGNDENDNNQFQMFGILAAIVAPFVAMLIQMALSRRRECLADATGAMTTRYPEGLIGALEKIDAYGSQTIRQNSSTAHLFFANPLKGSFFGSLFSTHPPIEDRIARLRKMGRGL